MTRGFTLSVDLSLAELRQGGGKKILFSVVFVNASLCVMPFISSYRNKNEPNCVTTEYSLEWPQSRDAPPLTVLNFGIFEKGNRQESEIFQTRMLKFRIFYS
jgi:hypothetical protein